MLLPCPKVKRLELGRGRRPPAARLAARDASSPNRTAQPHARRLRLSRESLIDVRDENSKVPRPLWATK
jgi:hypothetical protein